LQPFSEKGAAVIEFVMLGPIAIAIFLTGLTSFANSYIDSVVRVAAIEISRNAALADQSRTTANAYLLEKLKTIPAFAKATASLEYPNSNFVICHIKYTPRSLLLWLPQSVTVNSGAPIEK
jgi:hypothetical protein